MAKVKPAPPKRVIPKGRKKAPEIAQVTVLSDHAYSREVPEPAPAPKPEAEVEAKPEAVKVAEKAPEKPESGDSGLAAELGTVLADVFTLYAMAQGFHWNVVGPTFAQDHEFFGEVYEDAWGSVDRIAENIRKVGAPAPAGLSTFVKLREIEDAPASSDRKGMYAHLDRANAKVIYCLQEVFAVAERANEQGIANFAAERIDQHQKWGWQIKSTLEG